MPKKMGKRSKRDPKVLIAYIENFLEYKTRPKIDAFGISAECHHYLDQFTTLEHFDTDIFQCEICETLILNNGFRG